jgi:tetratricopeptide (TPR) repeat protein
MFTKMPTSASWRVLIHEVFHNFGYFCSVDSGHNFAEVNRNKWPSWYADAVKSNNGKTGELFWYEGIIKRRDNSDEFVFLKRFRENWLPAKPVLERAIQYSSRTSSGDADTATRLIREADSERKRSNVKNEIALLSEANRIAPFMPLPLFKCAYSTQWSEKNFEKSVPLYEKYLDLFGGFEDSDTSLVYLLGWYSSRDPGKALKFLEEYGGNPVNNKRWSEFTLRKIKLLKTLGRESEAMEIQGKALNDPRNVMKTEIARESK